MMQVNTQSPEGRPSSSKDAKNSNEASDRRDKKHGLEDQDQDLGLKRSKNESESSTGNSYSYDRTVGPMAEQVQRHVDKILQNRTTAGLTNSMLTQETLSEIRAKQLKDEQEQGSGHLGQQGHLPTTGSSGDSSDNHASTSQQGAQSKPPVGTAEWQKARRDSHKEVERRRRENINQGINMLADLVPECDKKKGKILEKAYDYILMLQQKEKKAMEETTLEKLLTEQAIAELSSRNKALQEQLSQAWREAEQWKKACESHGITDVSSSGSGSGSASSKK